eukprot:scaffold2120_cov259-Pinguiococcus_pyrenoidosus.AAC.13
MAGSQRPISGDPRWSVPFQRSGVLSNFSKQRDMTGFHWIPQFPQLERKRAKLRRLRAGAENARRSLHFRAVSSASASVSSEFSSRTPLSFSRPRARALADGGPAARVAGLTGAMTLYYYYATDDQQYGPGTIDDLKAVFKGTENGRRGGGVKALYNARNTGRAERDGCETAVPSASTRRTLELRSERKAVCGTPGVSWSGEGVEKVEKMEASVRKWRASASKASGVEGALREEEGSLGTERHEWVLKSFACPYRRRMTSLQTHTHTHIQRDR